MRSLAAYVKPKFLLLLKSLSFSTPRAAANCPAISSGSCQSSRNQSSRHQLVYLCHHPPVHQEPSLAPASLQKVSCSPWIKQWRRITLLASSRPYSMRLQLIPQPIISRKVPGGQGGCSSQQEICTKLGSLLSVSTVKRSRISSKTAV